MCIRDRFYFLGVQAIANCTLSLRGGLMKWLPGLGPVQYYLLIWALGAGLTLGGYRFVRMKRWASAGWRMTAILWPLLILVPFSLATAKKWERGSEDPGALGPVQGGVRAPLVILILDMIGYEVAFSEDGAVRDGLPGLSAFAESAMVFHRAMSPGDWTYTSLPGLILQEEVDEPLLEKGEVQWKGISDSNRPPRVAGEFERALPYQFRAAGGRAVYIGYYLPWKELMPDAWNAVFTRPLSGVECVSPCPAWLQSLLFHASQYVYYSKDPLAAIMKQFDLFLSVQLRYHRKLTWAVFNAGQDFLRNGLSPGDMVLIHLPIPHGPYVFDAKGRSVQFTRNNPPGTGYPEQLQFADGLFAEQMDALKNTGWWDRSWVVMMSDHGLHHKDYGETPFGRRHVPFMVKAPGQTRRQDVWDPIRLADFSQIPGLSLGAEHGVGQNGTAEGF